ncbi:MAG: CIA30 family protein [Akkermansiaceae bacterium]
MKPSLHCFAILASAVGLSPMFAANNTIVEFDPSEAKSFEWRVVDDGVMGGRSKGQVKVSDDGVLTFQGKLSLENNGGFSSIRTGKIKKDLSPFDGLVTRVKGDGRTYQMRLTTDARFRGMEISFKADFETKKGEWIEVKIPFSEFSGSFRGMSLKNERFNPSKIQRLGMLLADKKPGDFKLQVDWVRAYGGQSGDIVSTALADGRFGTLGKLLTEAKLLETLQGKGPFTVFAPTDEAFAKMPKEAVVDLLKPENREKLQSILTFHVIAGSVDLSGALSAGQATTVQGAPLTVKFAEGSVRINEANLVNADIKCSNGVIHVIDSVILPPKPANDLASVAEKAGSFKTLLAAVKAAGLMEVLTGDQALTVFAPTDEAFAKLPKGTVEALLKPENRDKLKSVLALHVVPGKVSAGDALNAGQSKALSGGSLEFGISDGLFQVNGSTIVKTDIKCDNGLIHVIDAVLLPSSASKDAGSGKTAAQMIEEAIERGVPVFNGGDHAGCATIYRKCMMGIAQSDQVDDRIGKVIGELVKRADQIEDDSERAWILRGGLDHLYSIMSGS